MTEMSKTIARKQERLYRAALATRVNEDRILALMPDSEVAQQVRDHREAGRWTTQHDVCPPKPDHL